MKSNKKIIIISAVFGAMALASTGFASWIITTESTQVADGTVSVETVSTNDHVITVTPGENTCLSFGAPATMDIANAWLTNTDGTAENRTVTYTVSVSNGGTAVVSGVTFSNAANVTSAISKGYITQPTATISGSTLIVSYSWGATFGNKNPYNYYNGMKFDAALPDTDGCTVASGHAQKHLAELQTLLNGVTFTVTLVTE